MAVEALPETVDLGLIDFRHPPPRDLSDEDRTSVISNSLGRIWDGAEELRNDLSPDSLQAGGNSGSELWMLLIVRMITRVTEPPPDFSGDEAMEETREVTLHDYYARQDQLRQTLCDYIMTDFPSRFVCCLFLKFKLSSTFIFCRVRLATTWMNEEWYNDQLRSAKDRQWVSR